MLRACDRCTCTVVCGGVAVMCCPLMGHDAAGGDTNVHCMHAVAIGIIHFYYHTVSRMKLLTLFRDADMWREVI